MIKPPSAVHSANWGLLSIGLHWLTALFVVALYALGWYMVELDYYDSWYRLGPFWHKSFGLLLFGLVLFRVGHRFAVTAPPHLSTHTMYEILLAKAAHVFLYVSLIVTCISGYMISTADGRGISFFGWFELPAIALNLDNQEDLAGEVHVWATNFLVTLAILHGAAALKHHFVDRDETLMRMLGRKRQ